MDYEADIRRTIPVRNVAGKMLCNVMREYATQIKGSYVQKLILDIDEKKSFIIGITTGYCNGAIMIRTGKNLDNFSIDLDTVYDYIGVSNAAMLTSDSGFACGLSESGITSAVNVAKDGLEKLLRK